MINPPGERARAFLHAHGAEIRALIRYYSVGLVNTAFGYGLFAGLLYLGFNLYLAQLVAHVSGTTFNYFTYSRHVFRKSDRRPLAFLGSYAVNYFLGLGLLAATHYFVKSPYLAGFVALLIGSVVNYLILKRLVFPARREPT